MIFCEEHENPGTVKQTKVIYLERTFTLFFYYDIRFKC